MISIGASDHPAQVCKYYLYFRGESMLYKVSRDHGLVNERLEVPIPFSTKRDKSVSPPHVVPAVRSEESYRDVGLGILTTLNELVQTA